MLRSLARGFRTSAGRFIAAGDTFPAVALDQGFPPTKVSPCTSGHQARARRTGMRAQPKPGKRFLRSAPLSLARRAVRGLSWSMAFARRRSLLARSRCCNLLSPAFLRVLARYLHTCSSAFPFAASRLRQIDMAKRLAGKKVIVVGLPGAYTPT